jgi:hypothetical protein
MNAVFWHAPSSLDPARKGGRGNPRHTVARPDADFRVQT